MVKISVSVLSKNDNESLLKLNKLNFDYIHVDVMDGKFVNEMHFPLTEIERVKNNTTKKMDIHLMVNNPAFFIDKISSFNPEYITVHFESLNGDLSVLEKIKNNGIKCGISVKPITDIKDIFYLLDSIDLVLIMSVEPGYGGQTFMEDSLDKVKLLKEEIAKRGCETLIAIDGGINNDNAESCIEAGCDVLVSGSYILDSSDWQNAIDTLKE